MSITKTRIYFIFSFSKRHQREPCIKTTIKNESGVVFLILFDRHFQHENHQNSLQSPHNQKPPRLLYPVVSSIQYTINHCIYAFVEYPEMAHISIIYALIAEVAKCGLFHGFSNCSLFRTKVWPSQVADRLHNFIIWSA